VNELCLFAGGGGGLLATKWLLGWETVCYVEHAAYPIEILKARIRDGYLDDAPIWDDVRTFDGRPWRGCVDIVTAGFPCPPFSTAGKRLAGEDPRNMWPDTARIIRECHPPLVFLENVPGLISSGYIFTVVDDLVEAGYAVAPPLSLGADNVGAGHIRKRIWILAYTDDTGCAQQRRAIANETQYDTAKCAGDESAHVDSLPLLSRLLVHNSSGARPRLRVSRPPDMGRGGDESIRSTLAHYETKSRILGVADGVASRVDRLESIGNGQVPLVAATAWRILTGEYE